MKKDIKIKQFIHPGVFETDEIGWSSQLLECAGEALDQANSHEICGDVLFQDDKGKFYVGSVEFVIQDAVPAYVADELGSGDFSECSRCGNIENSDYLEPIDICDKTDDQLMGNCSKCGKPSYLITKTRAMELAVNKKGKK
jgi:hypothetical protein